jgi:hypothetical protein
MAATGGIQSGDRSELGVRAVLLAASPSGYHPCLQYEAPVAGFSGVQLLLQRHR